MRSRFRSASGPLTADGTRGQFPATGHRQPSRERLLCLVCLERVDALVRCGSLPRSRAVHACNTRGIAVEGEAESTAQAIVLRAGLEWIMLDDMSIEDMRYIVTLCGPEGPRLEASGSITLDLRPQYAVDADGTSGWRTPGKVRMRLYLLMRERTGMPAIADIVDLGSLRFRLRHIPSSPKAPRALRKTWPGREPAAADGGPEPGLISASSQCPVIRRRDRSI
ncbi:hypothetical protein [Amycolatopsis cynarae]|uniref:hypothetical protein n=1 Tax=Amycolatopsis cynarae TaxID=2995223 RepID=UPI003898E2E9